MLFRDGLLKCHLAGVLCPLAKFAIDNSKLRRKILHFMKKSGFQRQRSVLIAGNGEGLRTAISRTYIGASVISVKSASFPCILRINRAWSTIRKFGGRISGIHCDSEKTLIFLEVFLSNLMNFAKSCLGRI